MAIKGVGCCCCTVPFILVQCSPAVHNASQCESGCSMAAVGHSPAADDGDDVDDDR